jgi:hypothetical protein
MIGTKTASLFAESHDTVEGKKPKIKATVVEKDGNYVLTFPKCHDVTVIRETENGNPYVTISAPSVTLRFNGKMPDGKGGEKEVKDFDLSTSNIAFRLNL